MAKLIAEPKSIQPVLGWNRDGASIRFEAPVEIDDVTEEGLFLFGRARLALPNRDVTLGLRWTDLRHKGGCFERLDWRHIAAHNNRNVGPVDLRFAVQEGTHRHPMVENAALPRGLLKAIENNLPVAIPIDPDPQDWASLVTLAGTIWNFPGLQGFIPVPEWQLSLVPPTGGEQPPKMKGQRR